MSKMIKNLNKSEFETKIGKFYYLWEDRAGGTVIYYLGNDKKDFGNFLRNIKRIYRDPNSIYLIDKKSNAIETAIIGYLDRKIKKFDFKVEFLTGTSFQKRIWKKLASVPYGETVSYKRLSFLSGYERAWRAVGSALSKNPVILVIPCHRVIKSDGRIGRFTGGPELKEFLVNLEKGAG
jgi:O-6-methylguanine DNA methyltransferase